MNLRRASSLLVLAFSLLLIGCGSPWISIKTATPNPFANQRGFAVAPVQWEGLVVGHKDEVDYLSEKDAEQQASWDEDKGALNDMFTNTLMSSAEEEGLAVVLATAPTSAPYFVRGRVTFIEPGVFTGVFNLATVVKMQILFTDPSGAVLDEIRIESTVGASLFNPSSGGRIRAAAEELGKRTAQYLRFRVTGED